MAAERLSILSVRNDVIQVGLPYLEGAPETYLTSAVAANGVTLTVRNNTRLLQNDYVILGGIGGQQSEIKRITGAVTLGTALTVAATTFAHPVGAKVVLTHYDQVEIYGSSSASDAAPTLIGSAVNIDIRKGYTEIKIGTTYTYYFCRGKDSNAGTYSSYSDSILATGLTPQARGEIKKEFLSIFNERLDELISDDWMNRSINRWQRDLLKRRKQWSVLRTITSYDSVQDQQGYTLPSDIQDLQTISDVISVKWYNQSELTYADSRVFTSLTSDHIGTTLGADIAVIDTTVTLTDASDFADAGSYSVQGDEMAYTSKSGNTLSGVTGITATHTSGDEVWQTRTQGQPNTYTINNGKILIYPIFDSASANRDLDFEYWKKFPDLADDADTTLFLYPENCYLYLHWQAAIRRKLPLNEQEARRSIWKDDLETMAADDKDFRDITIQPQNLYSNPY